MAISGSLVTQWSSSIQQVLEKSLVYSRLYNRNYEGEVRGGNQLEITSISDVTINSHTRNSAISWEALTDSTASLNVDQESYFAFMVSDLDRKQTNVDFLAEATKNAVYGVQDEIDEYLAAQLEAAEGSAITTNLGTDGTPLEINSGNIGSTLRLISRSLDDAKCPREGRVIVLPPFMVEDLVAANISDATNNSEALNNGYVGRYAGLEILMSHNVPNTTSTAYKIFAGSAIGQTMAIAVNDMETMRLQNYIADGVRGLVAYGCLVLKPEILAVATCNEAAEA